MERKTTNHDTFEPSVTSEAAFRSLLRVYGLLKRVMEPYFATFGISGSQWAVLRTLHRAKIEGLPSLRVGDIGERVLIRPPSVTGVVGRLQRMGLVAREASSTDSRARQVSLTPSGNELVERVLDGHKAKISDVLSGLSPAEQSQLDQLLGRICTHVGKIVQYKEESNVC
jgi:DNA-binding MarR family transcriptional regulator